MVLFNGAKINREGYHLVIVIQKKFANKKNREKHLIFLFKCYIFAVFRKYPIVSMKCIYKIIISNLILLLLVGVAALIFFPEIRPSFLDREPQDPMEVEGYSWEEEEERYLFLGHRNSVFLKGALLDEAYRKEYDALKDSLYYPEYGDVVFGNRVVTRKRHEEGYLYDDFSSPKYYWGSRDNKAGRKRQVEEKLAQMKKGDKLYDFFKYMLLFYDGKVDYPKLVDFKDRGCSFVKFDDYYKFYTTFMSYRDMPCILKSRLRDFLKEEGEGYTLDKNRIDKTFLEGSYTEEGEKDYCIAFKEEEAINPNYKVIFYREERPEDYYYPIYLETFYQTVLLKEGYKGQAIYMDTEERKAAPYPFIFIKQEGQPDVALLFNPDYDRMIPYTQLPKSQLDAYYSGEENEE